MEEIVLKLDNFQGPIDLLLTLVQKRKIKIIDIQITEVIDEYLAIMETAKVEDFDIKAEFLVVASELLEIKADHVLLHMLESGKGKNKVVHRLEEYAIIKELTKRLRERENEYNVSYSRGETKKITRRLSAQYTLTDLVPTDIFRMYARKLDDNRLPTMDLNLEREYSLSEEAEKLYHHIGTEIRDYHYIFERAESLAHCIYIYLSILELYRLGYIDFDMEKVEPLGKEWVQIVLDEDNAKIMEESLELSAQNIEAESNSNKKKKNKTKVTNNKKDSQNTKIKKNSNIKKKSSNKTTSKKNNK